MIRRAFLRAGVGATAGLAVAGQAGCARTGSELEVFVTWSGAELAAFRGALSDFTAATGHRVRVVPAGEQLIELLRVRLDTANPPDLVIGPVLGLIRQYAAKDRVVPLDGVGGNTPEGLRNLVTVKDKGVIGVWVKAAHKSLFWHRASTFAATDPPQTLEDLKTWVHAAAAAGDPPLAVGAADGWVLTDWFENTLVAVGGGSTYREAEAGGRIWDSAPVTEALEWLAELWSVPGAFPGGPARALLTQYEESVVRVFGDRSASLVFEGDFVTVVADRFNPRPAAAPDFFAFPQKERRATPEAQVRRPLVVGGDVAALLNDTPPGKALIRWLDDPAWMMPLVQRGGFLSPKSTVTDQSYPPGVARRIARQFLDAEAVYFDLSDQFVGRLGGGPGRGMWRILQEFFRAVTWSASSRASAVRDTRHELMAASEVEPA
jgi:hypothetical protein